MHKQLTLVIFLLGIIVFDGCAVADKFGYRAVEYNSQASDTRNQVLMLNILRSAYRKPLMFTDLPSVTGSASATGGIGTELPLGGAAAGYQINPIASLSGGPTFNLVTLNTKEFYSGMLSPIPIRIFGSYVAQGRPLGMLASLFISDITITTTAPCPSQLGFPNRIKDRTKLCVERFSSTYDRGSYYGFYNFQELVSELNEAGLSTEPVYLDQGPLTNAGNDLVAGLPAAGMRLKKYPLDQTEKKTTDMHPASAGKATGTTTGKTTKMKSKETAQKKDTEADNWHIELAEPDLELCFDPQDAIDYSGLKFLNQQIIESKLCSGSQFQPGPSSQSTVNNNIKFRFRSTLGIIYHLGELVRTTLSEPSEAPPLYFFPKGKPVEKDILFRISKQPPTDRHSISVRFEGDTYCVLADLNGKPRDHSSEILEMVEELIALNSSAKDLPSPAALTVVGQ
ncbi:MAG: hypothetical protein ABSG46_02450 [Candidatus Binataceae bacterium]|jgi:hypothetical protein